MRKISTLLFALISFGAFAQNGMEYSKDAGEIRLYPHKEVLDRNVQLELAAGPLAQRIHTAFPNWSLQFNERTQLPNLAFGAPTSVAGGTIQEKAVEVLKMLSCTSESLRFRTTVSDKYQRVIFDQTYHGLTVLHASSYVKFFNEEVISFGSNYVPDLEVNVIPSLSSAAAIAAAQAGIEGTVVSSSILPELAILPVPTAKESIGHLVYEVRVNSVDSDKIPHHYIAYVDAHTGAVLERRNTVHHADGNPKKMSEDLVVDVQVNGDLYLTNPFDALTTSGLNNVYVTVNASQYTMDTNGGASLPVNAGASATIRLEGPYSSTNTNGIVPQKTVTLQAGTNTISMSDVANDKELSAYKSVNRVHDFMKSWMPTFTGMDFQLPTNIDLTSGTCNAFYDGSSINFYALGGGCNAAALVADIIFHEYGHGINDNYYQSLGSFWVNGAMGEGYADFWAVSGTNNPVLGTGFYTDNLDPIRRYDTERKVYPMDLVGEVHADGEIIMGAWYDSHLLMGGDWNVTMPIFLGAYSGLQAEAADGNEGVAYTQVLLDALLADDNDGNITNGTPHGLAIVEGFYLHGITLITPADLAHTPVAFQNHSTPFSLQADVTLDFPFAAYLQEVDITYKVNNGAWITETMTDMGGGSYQKDFTGFPLGTVLSYYMTAVDANGSFGAVNPAGAQLSYCPSLPHIVLIGVSQFGVEDCDNNETWGSWQTGIAGDNNSTGTWLLEIPISSLTVDVAPGTMVQTGYQVTEGGEYCFITGNANPTDGIGANDVDGGKTTLQTPTINMASIPHPIVSYYRWYTNSPPGGANPGADFWQVRMSNDNGQTWTYVENTLRSDMRWRRNAFHVEDYMTPTATMRFQFIASDSTHLGQNLDGGSLVEGALDDFIVYGDLTIGVDELAANSTSVTLFPNPTSNQVNLSFSNEAKEVSIRVVNANGQVMYNKSVLLVSKEGVVQIPTNAWANGMYQVIVNRSNGTTECLKLIKE